MKKYITLLLVMCGIVNAIPFLVNGDFEQPLTVGWFQNTNGGNMSIVRDTIYDSDPDYEVYVYKGTGSGFAKLYQTVQIPTTDLEFSVNVKLYASSTSSTCWASSAVVIAYLNGSDSLLGKTMICYHTSACPWTSSESLHVIEVVDSLWYNYAFNIDSELVNLGAVNPADIKKVQIALLGYAVSS